MSRSASAIFPNLAAASNERNHLSVETAQVPARSGGLRFGLFLLLTAIIFLRPAEVLPALQGLPIYECVILACTVVSLPVLIEQLRWRTLAARPWTFCVLALLPAITLADLSHANLYGARTNSVDFAKILIYYLLLVGLIDSPDRLSKFMLAVALFVTVLAGLALLQYHALIDLPALEAMVENVGDDAITGETTTIVRLMATGVFNDPNDFSLILGTSIIVGLYWVLEQRRWSLRAFWIVAVGVLTYAFILTRSRGGFLALMGGGAVFLIARFGWRRALISGIVLLPLVLFVFGGRQTSIDIGDTNDTGQARIQLWRGSLYLFRAAPVFGIGVGQLAEANSLVAHNSYVHAFTELGLLGGTLFVGCWYILFAALRKGTRHTHARAADRNAEGGVHKWRPYILGMIGVYVVGLYSLTRCYAVPTYLVLGAAGAYCALLLNSQGIVLSLSRRLCLKVGIIGLCSILFLDIFVRVFAQ